MPKQRGTRVEDRLYTKSKGKTARYYADFRDFADVGGKQEALKPEGSRSAATDKKIAVALARARLKELTQARARANEGTPDDRSFDALVVPHLRAKAAANTVTEQWLGNVRVHLEMAAQFFGPQTDLAVVSPKRVGEYAAWLLTQPNGRGGTLSSGSVHQYLGSLHQLYRRAVYWELLAPGVNPVGSLFDRPPVTREKTLWLEVPEVIEVLRFAFVDYEPTRTDLALPWFPEVLATIALTGCRETEVYGLRACEVDINRGVLRIQQNEWRDLKTPGSERTVRIPTQLWGILRDYREAHRPQGDLFFPSARCQSESMITDIRAALDHMPMPERLRRRRTPEEMERLEAKRDAELKRWEERKPGQPGPKPKRSIEELSQPIDEWAVPALRTRMLRHSWAAARLQTLDHGAPVSIYTVGQEMGHVDIKMLKHIYAHLGEIRVRGEEVAFRW